MGAAREHWEAIRVGLGFKRFLLVPVLGVLITGADIVAPKLLAFGFGGLIGVPSWAIGTFFGTVLVTYWLLEYVVDLRRQIFGTRVSLSKLRSEGVSIRNKGAKRFQTLEAYEEWHESVLDWNDRTISEIRKINEADAEWYAVLDIVEPPRLPIEVSKSFRPALPWDELHDVNYRQHDFRLKRLGEMIQNLWRDG